MWTPTQSPLALRRRWWGEKDLRSKVTSTIHVFLSLHRHTIHRRHYRQGVGLAARATSKFREACSNFLVVPLDRKVQVPQNLLWMVVKNIPLQYMQCKRVHGQHFNQAAADRLYLWHTSAHHLTHNIVLDGTRSINVNLWIHQPSIEPLRSQPGQKCETDNEWSKTDEPAASPTKGHAPPSTPQSTLRRVQKSSCVCRAKVTQPNKYTVVHHQMPKVHPSSTAGHLRTSPSDAWFRPAGSQMRVYL